MIQCIIDCFLILAFLGAHPAQQQPGDTLLVRKTADFDISGNGSATNWSNTAWITLPQRTPNGIAYNTKAKLLYSETGMYFLFSCQDVQLTNTQQKDFLNLWNEDVIEIFLQPDPSQPVYFEYELSPLNYELPITIYNEGGNLNSWIPFMYDGNRKTKHATMITGGEKKPYAQVSGWTTEVYIPYKLLKPLMQTTPTSGTAWRGNLYRIDYDKGETLWSWQLTSGNFHEYEKFGTLRFE